MAATSAMTAFSYFLSATFRKLYKEPLLLQYLVSASGICMGTKAKAFAGWSLHYLIGLLFVALFDLGRYPGFYTASWPAELEFEIAIGIIGIAGWAIILNYQIIHHLFAVHNITCSYLPHICSFPALRLPYISSYNRIKKA